MSREGFHLLSHTGRAKVGSPDCSDAARPRPPSKLDESYFMLSLKPRTGVLRQREPSRPSNARI